jgi:hypothetical protein
MAREDLMDEHIEVSIIVTDRQGNRTATVLHNRASFLPNVGFIYRFLRTTKRKDAPEFFRFGSLDRAQATALRDLASHEADRFEEAAQQIASSLSRKD